MKHNETLIEITSSGALDFGTVVRLCQFRTGKVLDTCTRTGICIMCKKCLLSYTSLYTYNSYKKNNNKISDHNKKII